LEEASWDVVGHMVVRVPAPSREEDVDDTCELLLDSTLGRPKEAKLWLLSVRLSSELVFLLSITSPPAMITGFILSVRNGSADGRLPGAVVVRPRAKGVPLPLRRLTAPRRPYPSCPVPAAGPLRLAALSLASTRGTSAAVLVRRPKKANLDLNELGGAG